MSNPYQYQYQSSGQSLLPGSFQDPSQDPKLRWKILLLACFSTFGANFTSTFMSSALNNIMQTLQIDWSQYSDVMDYLNIFTCLAPLLAGFLLYRFGINSSFRLFALLLALGRLFTHSSLRIPSWFLFVIGQIMFQTANVGLIMTQFSMTVKWFKSKEICLAVGAIPWLNLLASRLGYYLANHIDSSWLETVLYIGSLFCFLSVVSVIYINKIDVKTSQTEQENSSFEEIRSVRPAVWALLAGIALFSVGDFTAKFVYVLDLVARFPFRKPGPADVIDNLWLYVPLVAFPLFGFLLDKFKGKRILATLVGIVIFFFGNIVFSAMSNSSDLIFIYLIYSLMVVGSCLFLVSSWACLGLGTPLRILGLVLGVAYTLINSANRIEEHFVIKNMGTDNKSFYWAAAMTLVAGIIAVGLTRVFDRKDGGRIESINRQDEGQNYENRPVNY